MAARVAIQASSVAKSTSRRSSKSEADADIITPPSIAPASLVQGKLGFSRGLDILVVDDPAYSIGQRLRRELTYLMGGNVRFVETTIDDLR